MFGIEAWNHPSFQLNHIIGFGLVVLMAIPVIKFWIQPDTGWEKKFVIENMGLGFLILLFFIITIRIAVWIGSPITELVCGGWWLLFFYGWYQVVYKEV
jgi:hypothetical protein